MEGKNILRSQSSTITQTKSLSQLLLEIVAISGEYPAENIHRLIFSQSYSKKVIYNLTNDKLLKTVYMDGVKGYRLTIKGKRKLTAGNPTRFEGYFDGDVETNKMRTDLTRRRRLHSMAHVYTLMHNSGVCIFQDTKPKVFTQLQPALSQTTNQASELRILQKDESLNMCGTPYPAYTVSVPCFYSSREQKVDENKSGAIRGSKSVGVLLTLSQAYAIYNTRNTQTNWWEKVELWFCSILVNI